MIGTIDYADDEVIINYSDKGDTTNENSDELDNMF